MKLQQLINGFAQLGHELVAQPDGLYGVRRPSGYVVPSGCDIDKLERVLAALQNNKDEGIYADSTADHCPSPAIWPQAVPKTSNVNRRLVHIQRLLDEKFSPVQLPLGPTSGYRVTRGHCES